MTEHFKGKNLRSRVFIAIGVIVFSLAGLVTSTTAADNAQSKRLYYLNADFEHFDNTYDHTLTPWFLVDTTDGSAHPDTVYRFETSSTPMPTHSGWAFWSLDESHIYLVDFDDKDGLAVDTLLRCDYSFIRLATRAQLFDLFSSKRLLATTQYDASDSLEGGVVVVRYTPGSCHFDTLAVMDSCEGPTFVADGSALLADQMQSSPNEDPPWRWDILVYDVGADSVYNLLPPTRERIRPRGESINGPIYYESYTDSTGSIWRYRKTEGEDMLYSSDSVEKLLGWGVVQDTLYVKVGRSNDTGYVEEIAKIDLQNQIRISDTTVSYSGRPEWAPVPEYSLVRDSRVWERFYYMTKYGTDTLLTFNKAIEIDQLNRKLLVCDSDSCRLVALHESLVDLCDTLWTCGAEVWRAFGSHTNRYGRQIAANGDSLLYIRYSGVPTRSDSRQTPGFALCMYTARCRRDTLFALKNGVQPCLTRDGAELLAVENVAAGDSAAPRARILMYDIVTGDTSFPIADESPCWNPVRENRSSPIYYLRERNGTNIYRYTPQKGEERLTDYPPSSPVVSFSVDPYVIRYRYLDRSGLVPTLRDSAVVPDKKQQKP